MPASQPFIDYYDILNVDAGCDEKTLESAYHQLAKLHHPDHSGDADITRFNEVTQAYRVLRQPEERAKYDELYEKSGRGRARSAGVHSLGIGDQGATDDADDHDKILLFLYKKRRENSQDAGVVGFYIQALLKCSHEHFEFHKWYLKEKGFIVTTEQGTLAITVQGVDHVISMSRTTQAQKLLSSQPDEHEPG